MMDTVQARFQDMVLCAQSVIEQHQRYARQQLQEPSVRLKPGMLLKLHHTVHTALAQWWEHRDDSSELQGNKLEQASSRLQAACLQAAQALPDNTTLAQQLQHNPGQVAAGLLEQRQLQLAAELESITQASQTHPDDPDHPDQQGQLQLQPPTLSTSQVTLLHRAVQLLRHAESDINCQAQMAAEVDELADTTQWTEDNFAYGSTPFTSWWQVLAGDPAVWPAVRSAMHPHGSGTTTRQYMVWGSSSGWLVFYGHIAFGWQGIGYDLLTCLVDRAQSVATQLSLPGVQFVAADLLDSDLSSVGVLVLTNQCWDRSLMRAVAAKLQAEVQPGTVVVEYTGQLKTCDKLVPVAVAVVPVSWNPGQRMYVWRAL